VVLQSRTPEYGLGRYHLGTAVGHGRIGLLLETTEIGGITDRRRAEEGRERERVAREREERERPAREAAARAQAEADRAESARQQREQTRVCEELRPVCPRLVFAGKPVIEEIANRLSVYPGAIRLDRVTHEKGMFGCSCQAVFWTPGGTLSCTVRQYSGLTVTAAGGCSR
jgi:hypothetical protein